LPQPKKYFEPFGRQKAWTKKDKVKDPEKWRARARNYARAYRERHPEYLKNRSEKYRDRRVKKIIQFGGVCEFCGLEYSGKNAAAFHFHHIDASTKGKRSLASLFISGSEPTLNDELKKCILLCSNCHEVLHGGEF
jgi:predicted HNH restriction endonuclease